MKEIVAIRKEKYNNSYLAYFLEQRIMINVNEIGSKVLTMFLNEEMSLEEIANRLSADYGINVAYASMDVKDFLNDIYQRLTTTNVNEAEQEKMDTPIGAEIEITTACNLRCKHCFQGEYPEKYMSFEKFKDIVDILTDNNVYEIHLVGGEIFKHPDIIRMFKYLNQKPVAVTIVTNATAIGSDELQVLKEMKRLYVLVSLDGTKELHDFIRGKGQFDLIIPKVRKMNDERIKVELLCTLNALNVDYVKEIAQLGKELDIPVNFNLFKPFTEAQQFLTVPPEKFFKAVETLLEMRVKNHFRLGVSDASIAAYMLKLPPKNECTATMSGLVINTDGKMLTCPYLLQSGYYTESELPNFDKDFVKKWNTHQVFTEFRKNGQVGCQARSLIFSHDTKKGDPYDLQSYIKYKREDKS